MRKDKIVQIAVETGGWLSALTESGRVFNLDRDGKLRLFCVSPELEEELPLTEVRDRPDPEQGEDTREEIKLIEEIDPDDKSAAWFNDQPVERDYVMAAKVNEIIRAINKDRAENARRK